MLKGAVDKHRFKGEHPCTDLAGHTLPAPPFSVNGSLDLSQEGVRGWPKMAQARKATEGVSATETGPAVLKSLPTKGDV